MTDDIMHSTQYYLTYINRATLYMYLGQFAVQIIETWQADSSIWNTPVTTKTLFPWLLTLFRYPTTWFQYVSGFQLEKR